MSETIKVGQIWKRKNSNRLVKVKALEGGQEWVRARNVTRNGTLWHYDVGSLTGIHTAKSFTKRFTLHEDVA